MKHLLSVVAVALALVSGSSAIARDGDGRRFDRGHSERHDYRGQRGNRHFDRRHSGDRKFYGDRKFDRRFNGDRRFFDRKFDDRKFFDRRFDDRRFFRDRKFDRRFDGRRFRDDRFYRSWRRGDRLPSVFLSTRFVINDFGSHRLYRPPRGYRWVRVERDAFLVGIATGVILTVATDRFF